MSCLNMLMHTMAKRREANNPPPVYKNEVQERFEKAFRNTPIPAYYDYRRIMFQKMEQEQREREAAKAERRRTGGG